MKKIVVWDLPLRLFHWSLAIVVTASWITGSLGGNAMVYHLWLGYTVLGLLLFRLGWGFTGSFHSRFRHFIYPVTTTIDYARSLLKRKKTTCAGHNPLGGWMVIVMLLALLTQAGTGLFANDDIFTEGPLANRVSSSVSGFMTTIHEWCSDLLLILVILHIIAIASYWQVFRENLVKPMLSGYKSVTDDMEPNAANTGKTLITALICAILSGLVVFLIVQM